MIRIYTSRINYKGLHRLDITVKSATGLGKLLAPTWALVGGAKGWDNYTPLSDQEYTDSYLKLLRSRYRENPQLFDQILDLKTIVLLCYCADGNFCHRKIAADVLYKIAIAKGKECAVLGEIAPDYKILD